MASHSSTLAWKIHLGGQEAASHDLEEMGLWNQIHSLSSNLCFLLIQSGR